MHNKANFFSVFVFLFLSFTGIGQDPEIEDIVNNISGNAIFSTIADLQDLDRVGNVSALSENLDGSAYLLNRLSQLELDSIGLHYFVDQNHNPNIIAVKKGTLYPDSIFVVGAHYDAVLPFAGADDNASGVGGLLEMIRVLQDKYVCKSVYFVFFAAEEQGLIGSNAWSNLMANTNKNIYGMLNFDGISHQSIFNNTPAMIVNDSDDANAASMVQKVFSASKLYVPALNLFVRQQLSPLFQSYLGISDHIPFQNHSIPAVHLVESISAEQILYYHQAADTIGPSANSPYLSQVITQACTATLLESISLCNPPANADLVIKFKIGPNIGKGQTEIIINTEVLEIAGNDTNGTDVTLVLDRNQNLTFSYEPNLSLLNGIAVNNDEWIYDENNNSFHIFRYNGLFRAHQKSVLGIQANFNPNNSKGIVPFTFTILKNSGGDQNAANNSDAEVLVYFPN